MQLKITNKQLISYAFWAFQLMMATIFFATSLHLCASFLLFIYTVIVSIWGILYAYKNKNIYIFNPVAHTIYTSIFYGSFMGLYCLSRFNRVEVLLPVTNDDTFLTVVSFIYLICFLLLLLPYFISMCTGKTEANLKIFNTFKKKFNYKKTCKYLYWSFGLIIILYIALCLSTGFTPISAILNPAEFRNECNRNIASYIMVLYTPLLIINYCITIKMNLAKLKTKSFKIYFAIFMLYCIFWAIFSGGRSWFVNYFFLFLYIYTMKEKIKISFDKAVKMLIVLSILVLFVGAYGAYRNYRTQLSRNNLAGLQAKNELTALEKTMTRMDTYSMSLKFFHRIDSDYGSLLNYNDYKLKDFIIGQFTMLIPRKIYSQKLEPAHGELTKLVDNNIYEGGVHIVYGGISSYFYEGGFLWMFIMFYIIGLITSLFQKTYKKLIYYDSYQIFYIMCYMSLINIMLNLGFLNELNTYTFFVKFIMTIIILRYICMKHIKSISSSNNNSIDKKITH